MSKKSFPYRIYPLDKDLTKRWYIQVPAAKNRVGDKPSRLWIRNFDTVEQRMADAEQILSQLNLLKEKSKKRQESEYKISFLRLLSDSLESCRMTLRKKSFQSYESQLRNFADFVMAKKVTRITDETGSQFLEWLLLQGKHPTTINKHRMCLKKMFRPLVKSKAIKVNPFDDTSKIRSQMRGSRYFKVNQIAEIKEQISTQCPEIWYGVRFIYYCFIRPGELRNVRIEDVDLDMWQIKVRAEISKNKKDQYVVIPNALRRDLEKINLEKYPPNYFLVGKDGYPSQNQIPINWLSTKHREVLRHLKYSPDYNLYSWKHTGVVQSYRAGMGLKELQLQLRHHSLDMVKIYLESLGILDFGNIRDTIPTI
jgi:integrase